MNEDLIKEIVGGLLTELGLSFSDIKVVEEADMTRAEIVSDTASRIIGWHGETLNSIQHLAKSILRQKEKLDRSPFLVLDVDGYRQSQVDALILEAVQKLGSREGGLTMVYGLYPGIPLANVRALMDALEKYATYYS